MQHMGLVGNSLSIHADFVLQSLVSRMSLKAWETATDLAARLPPAAGCHHPLAPFGILLPATSIAMPSIQHVLIIFHMSKRECPAPRGECTTANQLKTVTRPRPETVKIINFSQSSFPIYINASVLHHGTTKNWGESRPANQLETTTKSTPKTLNIHAFNSAHAYLPYKWMWVSSTKDWPKIGENPQLQTSLK